MKKTLAIVLALVMVLALCACGGSSAPANSAPAPAPTNAPAENNNASAEEPASSGFDALPTFDLTLSMHDPATSNNGMFYQAWADEINALTEGHVNITIYFSGALASNKDVADMVEQGGCDMGWVYTTFYPDQFPLSDITSFPFFGFGEPVSTTNTLWDLYETTPELQNEWSAYKLLNLYGNPGMLFASTTGPINNPDAVKNQVMRSPTGPITDLMNAMGGSPTVMGPGDIFDSIQKNVISGFVFEPAGICNFSLQEAATMYYTNYPMYDGVFALVMNWDTWNSLPAEFQAIFEQTTQRAGSLAAAEDFGAAAEVAKKTIADAGNTWVDLTDEEVATFKALADEVNAKWFEKYSANGFDYAAYAAHAAELLAQYK